MRKVQTNGSRGTGFEGHVPEDAYLGVILTRSNVDGIRATPRDRMVEGGEHRELGIETPCGKPRVRANKGIAAGDIVVIDTGQVYGQSGARPDRGSRGVVGL